MKSGLILGAALLLSTLDWSTPFQSSSSSSSRIHQSTLFKAAAPRIQQQTARPKILERVRLSSSAVTRSSSSTSLHSALAVVDAFWRTHPYIAAALVCGIKGSAADYVAQKRASMKEVEKAEEKAVARATTTAEIAAATEAIERPRTNKLRNFAYVAYSALYQGMFQEFMVNTLFPFMFGRGTDPITVLCKVCFDMTFQAIVLTIPAAYLAKALIFRFSVKEAYGRYMDDVRNHGLLTRYFMLWGPSQCITYSIVPEHLRVTFIAGISFFWLIILSSIASKKRPNTESIESSSASKGASPVAAHA